MLNLFIKENDGKYESIRIDSPIQLDINSGQQLYFDNNYESFTMTFDENNTSVKIVFLVNGEERTVVLKNMMTLIKENDNLKSNKTALILISNDEDMEHLKSTVLNEKLSSDTALENLLENIQNNDALTSKLFVIEDFASLMYALKPSASKPQAGIFDEEKSVLIQNPKLEIEYDKLNVRKSKEESSLNSNVDEKTRTSSQLQALIIQSINDEPIIVGQENNSSEEQRIILDPQSDDEVVSEPVLEVIPSVKDNLDYGNGDDNIYITGNISAEINLGDGDNTLVVDKTPKKIYAGSGDDTIVINAAQTSKVDLGEGDNTLTIGGFSKAISAGAGNDTITVNDSSKGNISLGNGNNIVSIKNSSAGITAGFGDDTVTIGANSNGKITLGSGNDTLIISGKSNDNISMGAGDDTVSIGGRVKESISLGSGDDSIVIGGTINVIIDGDLGVDTITLNAYTYDDYEDIKKYLINFSTIIFSDGETITVNEDGTYITPIILDLDADGIETLSINDGVEFDIDADGDIDITAWVGSDDGLLVRDINKDGIINDGSELFGEKTIKEDGTTANDGYDALRELDSNNDGVINIADDAFLELQIWKDSNSDGITNEGELLSLNESKVAEISLATTSSTETSNGSIIALKSTYLDDEGKEQEVADVWFEVEAKDLVLDADIDLLVAKVEPEVNKMAFNNYNVDLKGVLLSEEEYMIFSDNENSISLQESDLKWVKQDNNEIIDDEEFKVFESIFSADSHIKIYIDNNIDVDL